MAKSFTPGPWEIKEKSGDGKRILIGDCGEEGDWEAFRGEVDSDDCCSETAMANAKLIVAAPDLLQCLKEAIGKVDGPLRKGSLIDRSVTAIAKAEGME